VADDSLRILNEGDVLAKLHARAERWIRFGCPHYGDADGLVDPTPGELDVEIGIGCSLPGASGPRSKPCNGDLAQMPTDGLDAMLIGITSAAEGAARVCCRLFPFARCALAPHG